MYHTHGHFIDCGTGPWPYWLTTLQDNHWRRSFVGMYNRDERPSGIHLRSLQQRHRVSIESSIAMEQYK